MTSSLTEWLKQSLSRRCLLAACAAVCAGCQGRPPAPTTPRPSPRETLDPAPPQIAVPPPEPHTFDLDPLRLPPVHSETLASGIVLRHVPVRTIPLVYVRVAVPTGFGDDGDKPGLAALTARMLIEDVSGPNLAMGRQHIERTGIASSRVTRAATVFSLKSLSSDASQSLDLFATTIRRPSFSRESHQRALEASSTGESQTIEAWHCRAFHKTNYVASGTVVAVVGDISVEAATAFAQQIADGWAATRKPAASTSPPPERRALNFDGATNLVDVDLVAPWPANEHWPALWLVARTMSSCATPWADDLVMFRICGRVAPSEVDTWIRDTEAALQRVADSGLAPDELERAKHAVVDDTSRELSNPETLADMLVTWDPAVIDAAGDRVREVEDVRPAVRKLIESGEVRFVAGHRP